MTDEKTMIAAHLKGLNKFEIVETEIPCPKKGQVLVKLNYCGICGSDRGMWNGHHFFNELYDWSDFTPGEHGHEDVGTVVELGKGVTDIKVGDQVVRNQLSGDMDLKMAGFAEYTLSDCSIVCNGVDPEVMSFTDPVCVALNHIHHANVSSGDTVVVIGQGLLGLITTQLLRKQNVNVIATDVSNRRLRIAEGYGATTYNPEIEDVVKKIKKNDSSIQSVIECSGADDAVIDACHLISLGGRIVIMGATHTNIVLNYTQLRTKGITVCFPMNDINHPSQWEPAAKLLANGEVDVKEFVDHRDNLKNIQKVLSNYNEEWIRVLLKI